MLNEIEDLLSAFKRLENIAIYDLAQRMQADLTGDVKRPAQSPREIDSLIDKELRRIAKSDIFTKQKAETQKVFHPLIDKASEELSKNISAINDNRVDLVSVYKDTLRQAKIEVNTGLFDYQAISRKYITEMGVKGIQSVNYETGTRRRVEGTVRSTLITSLSQTAGKIALKNAEIMGADLMQISAHTGARPSHAEWQGKIVSRSGRPGYLSFEDIGYGDITGFQGINCMHTWYPIADEEDSAYTDEELNRMNDSEEKYEYNGKKYSAYTAGQKMREIERNISLTKRKLIAYQGAHDDNAFVTNKILLNRQIAFYKEFGKITNQQYQQWRTFVYNFKR